MEITSPDFNTHKKSLLEKGFIQENKQFSVKGKIEYQLYLTKNGKSVYQTLILRLSNLIDEPTPYMYLLREKKVLEGRNHLYPKNSENEDIE